MTFRHHFWLHAFLFQINYFKIQNQNLYKNYKLNYDQSKNFS